MIAAIYALAEGLFLVLLGVPLAGPLAVIVFFGRFIPYIGGLVTSILMLSVTLATQGSTDAVILLVLIAILSRHPGQVPHAGRSITGPSTSTRPLALIALPAGYALAGIVGLFIAIPVVAFVLATSSAVDLDPGHRTRASIARSRTQLVPVWLDRLGQLSWRSLVAIGLLGVCIAAAVQVPIVVLPLVLGVVLAATLAPLAKCSREAGLEPRAGGSR